LIEEKMESTSNVVVLGELEFEPGDRDLWLSYTGDLMKATNEEPGCHRYRISASPLSPDGVLFFEWYESADALAAHMASPHFRAFMEATAGCRLRERKIDRFHATPIR
jgi:quinol monooxygenase YgiN